MICPHCNIGIRFTISHSSPVYDDKDQSESQFGYEIANGFCPECDKLIIIIRHGRYWVHNFNDEGSRELTEIKKEQIIYPKTIIKNVEPEVPENIKKEFQEAAAILPISPRASAAMSRRLLQTILREKFSIKKGSLEAEIKEFLSLTGIPTFLSQEIDAIRNVGNFAAHPIKNTQTGEIVDVEPGEAEWLIDVLEALFDFTYIQPERRENRIKALNIKLSSVGKPLMK
jgi:hypothetical protein